MSSIGGVRHEMGSGGGRARRHPVLDAVRGTAADRPDHEDRFRAAVAALDPGPLQDVLTAVAYARDEAARSGAAAAPTGRWLAVIAAAERAVRAAAAAEATVPHRTAA